MKNRKKKRQLYLKLRPLRLKMHPRLTPWDIRQHLKTLEDMYRYLIACAAENDPILLLHAISDIAGTGVQQMRHGRNAATSLAERLRKARIAKAEAYLRSTHDQFTADVAKAMSRVGQIEDGVLAGPVRRK